MNEGALPEGWVRMRLDKRIIELKYQANQSFILLGREFKENQGKRYYEFLGYPTFEAYIESPEVSFQRRSVYSLIAIYEKFVEELGYSVEELSAIDYSKLDRLLPILNVQPVAHREWVQKAKKLSRRELEMEIRASKGKIQQESTSGTFTYSHDPSLPDEWIDTIQYGDCLRLLRLFPDDSVDFCMTSPPSWGDRDIAPGQLGSEPTWQGYIERSLEIYTELMRVLKEEGSFYLNLGDSYSTIAWPISGRTTHKNISPESLMGIPWRVALAMTDDGWILRNAIVWHKPNAMPNLLRDRLSNTYKTLFHFVKSQHYYYDLDAIGANPGDFWQIDAQPSSEAYPVSYPEELCVKPIKSSCPEDGIVLDIFAGAGTTLLAAKKLGRKYLGFEINPDYIEIANKRIQNCEGCFEGPTAG